MSNLDLFLGHLVWKNGLIWQRNEFNNGHAYLEDFHPSARVMWQVLWQNARKTINYLKIGLSNITKNPAPQLPLSKPRHGKIYSKTKQYLKKQKNKKQPPTARSVSAVHGAPNRIRTCGLLIRSECYIININVWKEGVRCLFLKEERLEEGDQSNIPVKWSKSGLRSNKPLLLWSNCQYERYKSA